MAKGRRHPRAQGDARSFPAAPVSEARVGVGSGDEEEGSTAEASRFCLRFARYYSMRRAPTTTSDDLHPATVRKKKKERETEEEKERKRNIGEKRKGSSVQ